MVNPGDLFMQKVILTLGQQQFELLRTQAQLDVVAQELQTLKAQNADRSETSGAS